MLKQFSVLLLMTASANAGAEYSLRCDVRDHSILTSKDGAMPPKEIPVLQDKWRTISATELHEGDYSCEVTYDLRNGARYFSMRLFRSDKMIASHFDRVFKVDKKVDSVVQTNDLSAANKSDQENRRFKFAAGTCTCKTFEIIKNNK